LVGPFPAITQTFVHLQTFTVSHNFLSGTIPSLPEGTRADVLLGLSDSDFRLQTLNIGYNDFVGLVPEFVGRIPTLREFIFAGNSFRGTYPTMPGMWRSLGTFSCYWLRKYFENLVRLITVFVLFHGRDCFWWNESADGHSSNSFPAYTE
jgi:hypothetical protein